MQQISTNSPSFFSPFVLPVALVTLPLLTVIDVNPAKSQITPEPNSTNTTVSPNGNRLDIGGGRTSQDGGNLFHSFDRFNVNQGQIANFLSNPQIRNILSRVVGGDASVINGLIQVTGGNSNLFLMNPSGIIFGSQASLNVPGSFFATTATGIGFNGNGWFSAIANNNYDTLIGNPNVFAFTNLQPGAIINAGNLAVAEGQTLGLLGGTVINTGQLIAPEGQITVMAVPGENLVRLTQSGNLLSLEIQPLSASGSQPNNFNLSILSLPQLLTGGNGVNATQVTVNNDGTISLSGSGLRISPETGTAVASGTLKASGGTVQVLGNKVGIVNSQIDVSGINGGGTVLIGGDFQGKGTVPNAINTYVSKDSVINADSLVNGKGGTVIVWADKSTQFYGKISAVGGSKSGNGGFVEISGKENLTFDGSIDVFAVKGEKGQVLFDPKSVIIGTDGTNDDELSDGIILASDGADDEIFYISASKLLEVLDSGNVAIAATENIDVNEPVDANSNTNANNLDLTAPIVNINAAITLKGDLTVTANTELNINNAISTSPGNGNINLSAGIGTLTTNSNGTIKAGTGDINLTANKIEIGASISGTGNLTLQPKSANQSIGIGDVAEGNFNLDASEINQLQDGFASITIGSDVGSGKVNITSVTFKDPVTIQSPNNSIITNGTITGTDDAAITFIAKGVELSGDIITNNSNIEFKNTPVTLKNDVTLKTGKGVISFSKEVDITDKALTLIAEEIDFLGGNVSVTGTGKIALQPGTAEQDIVIGGTSNSELSLDITKDDIAAFASGFESITIGGENGGGKITIDEINFNNPLIIQSPSGAGSIIAKGEITGTDNAAITLKATKVEVAKNISTAKGDIDFTNSPVTMLEDVTLNAGKGTIAFGNSLKIGEKALTLTADEIDFTGGVGSVTGSNKLILQPATPELDIAIANSEETTGLNLTNSDLEALQNGFKSVIIGREDGKGVVTVNPVTLKNSVTIQSPEGSIITKGTITGTGETAITFKATSLEIAGDIKTENKDIKLESSVTLTNDVELNAGKGTISFGKSVDAGEKVLTITADEIDFLGGAESVSGTNTLTLQPSTPELEITLGDSENSNRLDLTNTDLDSLKAGFKSVIIGREDGKGAVTIAGDITFNNSVTIQSPKDSGSIKANGTINATGEAEINLIAGGDISFRSINTNEQSVTIKADADNNGNGAVFTNLDDTIQTKGGKVDISGYSITVGNIDTFVLRPDESGDTGTKTDGGAVKLSATGKIATGNIDTRTNYDAIFIGDGYLFRRGGYVEISTSGEIEVKDVKTAGGYLNIAGGSIRTGNILTYYGGSNPSGDPKEGLVTLEANTGDIVVSTIEAGSGGIDIKAFNLFRAEKALEFGLIGNTITVIDEIKNNPELIAFFESKGFSKEVLENSQASVRIDPEEIYPVSVIAYSATNDPPIIPRISIQHGGISLTKGDSSTQGIHVQGRGEPFSFVIGPRTDSEEKFQLSEFSETTFETFDPSNPSAFIRLERVGNPRILEIPGELPNNVSGTVGSILVGNDRDNVELYSSLRDVPLTSIPEAPVTTNPPGNTNPPVANNPPTTTTPPVAVVEPPVTPTPPVTTPPVAVVEPPVTPTPPVTTPPVAVVEPPVTPTPPVTTPPVAVVEPPVTPTPPVATPPVAVVEPPVTPTPPVATPPVAVVEPPVTPTPPVTTPPVAVEAPVTPTPPVATPPVAVVEPPVTPTPPVTTPPVAVVEPPVTPTPPVAINPPATTNPPVSNQPPTNNSGDVVASNPNINEVATRGSEIIQSVEQKNQQPQTQQDKTPLPEKCQKRRERSNTNNQNESSQEEEECEELPASQQQQILRQGILRLEPKDGNNQSNPQSLPESLTGGKGGNATEIRTNDGAVELRGSGVQIEK